MHWMSPRMMPCICMGWHVQAAALRANTARAVLGDQLAQAQEKRARNTQLCRLYTNPVRPEYFAQFETSHR